MLSKQRILVEGKSPHAHEQEAIAFVRSALPDHDPYLLWALVDLQDRDGRLHQLDAIILGHHALYLVEIKSHPGRVTGNLNDWLVEFPGGGRTRLPNPYPLCAEKARILAGQLDRAMPKSELRPWVEPLVFLSSADLRVELADAARANVVTRADFARAITHGEVPVSGPRLRQHADRRPVNRPVMKATLEAMKAIGLRPSQAVLKLGDLQLQEEIEAGPGYQDWSAQHEAIHVRRRVRLWLVPQSQTQERREQLARAAKREAEILSALSEHRGVLHLSDYRVEGPTGGPAIVFDEPEALEPLEAFIRRRADLSFDHRIALLEQVGSALGYCHRKGVFHRNLNPGAVLVRERPGDAPEAKLYNFQLAAQEHGTAGTLHLSAFTSDRAAVYRAPEVFEDPVAASTSEADLFSLGALAWFVLTGRHPGATLVERLQLLNGDGLSLAAAADGLASGEDDAGERSARTARLDDVVKRATHPNPLERAAEVDVWLSTLLDAATAPDVKQRAHVDPVLARPGETLENGLFVEDFLGEGSTARVLKVIQERGPGQDLTLALKVALPGAEERLAAEAEALRRVQSERIVRFVDEVRVTGRSCLVLGLAGETLGQWLSTSGPPGLDYARRWGEDLLEALAVLEEHGVLHRDVKPANLGLTPAEQKKTRRLFLFDLSLAGVRSDAIDVGTPAYRDPFLPARGRWDSAGDRWSAAVTLHELLTASRPKFGSGDAPALAIPDEATIASDLFDAAIRERLTAFFRKALARDVAARHESAEQMRTHWVSCFGPAMEVGAPARPTVDDTALARLADDASIELLPLSPAARNALDRIGVITVGELAAVSDNQLRIRHAGRETAQEVVSLAKRLRAVRTTERPPEAPFFPGYRGGHTRVAEILNVSERAAEALEDAGLARATDVAAAAKVRIERLLAKHDGALTALRAFLAAEQKDASSTPATIEGYLDALLPIPRRTRGDAPKRDVRLLLGLDRRDDVHPGDARSVANALGVTRQAVHVSLGRLKKAWATEQSERIRGAREAVLGSLAALGGAAPVTALADCLPRTLPHEVGHDAGEEARLRAQALIRVIVEASPALEDAPLTFATGRVGTAQWIARSEELLDAARSLGRLAAELCRRDPLPASEEVQRALSEAAAGTPLASEPPDRLIHVAAEASGVAAPSARLELYPRGLEAAKALRLSAGALPVAFSADELRALVSARYPEAAPLPSRPELDELLVPLGYAWDAESERWKRKGIAAEASPTKALSTRRATVHLPATAKKTTEQLDGLAFDQALRVAVEKKHFRVLDVNEAWHEDCVAELKHRLRVEPRSLDRELLREAEAILREKRANPARLAEADRAGPSSGDWGVLQKVMREAAERVAAAIVKEPGPVVLVHPGLLARYQLGGFLSQLVDAASRDGAPALLLVNPVWSQAGLQGIDGGDRQLDVPVGTPNQRMTVPQAWIQNKDRGGVA